jgi:hypothetical protein
LSYSLGAGAPAGAAIHPTSGLFTWTPSEAQGPGAYPITITVTDDGSPALSHSRTFQGTVNEVNQAPVLAPLADREVQSGRLLSFSASASDPDQPANALSYALGEGAPQGAAIDPLTGLFTWMPPAPGVYTITVIVTDSGSLSHSRTFTVTVLPWQVWLPVIKK